MSQERDSFSNRKQLCTPRVKNTELSMVQTKSARHPEQATISDWEDTPERKWDRDPSSPARSKGENFANEHKTEISSFSEFSRHVPIDSVVLELYRKVLLSFYLLSDGAHGTVEEVLETGLERTTGIAKICLTCESLSFETIPTATRSSPSQSRKLWLGG